MDAPARSRVGLRVGGRTVDVAIPAGVPVYEALRAAGVDLDDTHLALVDSVGRPVDRYSTTADDLTDGAVLHVVSLAPSGRATKARTADADPAATRPGSSAWWLGAAGVAAVVLLATTVLDMTSADRGLTLTDRTGLAVLLGVVALALAAVRGRPGALGSAWPTVVAGLVGAAAGVAMVDPGPAGSGRLMVVAGLVGALVPVAARWAVGRRARDDVADLAAVLLMVLAAAAAVTTVALLLDLPPALPAAVLLGAVPLGLRALPALCVDVPDEQLVDVTLVARTVSAVRAPVTEPLGPVNERMVVRTVRRGERRRDAGTVVLALTAPVVAPALLLAAEPGLTGWAATGACLLVVLALCLGPRTVRGSLLRWIPRVGGLLVLVELAVLGVGGAAPGTGAATGSADASVGLTVAVLALGLAVVALSVPIGRGWRSVGFSRLADTVEGLATVLALPVALVGAGAVEAFRALGS